MFYIPNQISEKKTTVKIQNIASQIWIYSWIWFYTQNYWSWRENKEKQVLFFRWKDALAGVIEVVKHFCVSPWIIASVTWVSGCRLSRELIGCCLRCLRSGSSQFLWPLVCQHVCVQREFEWNHFKMLFCWWLESRTWKKKPFVLLVENLQVKIITSLENEWVFYPADDRNKCWKKELWFFLGYKNWISFRWKKSFCLLD